MKNHAIVSTLVLTVLLCSTKIPAAEILPDVDIAPLWKVGIITDTQTSKREWTNALLASIKSQKPQMLIHTGDTDFLWSDMFTLRAIGRLCSSSEGIEFHLAPGNHDMAGGRLREHLRQAATEGIFRLDKLPTFAAQHYLSSRVLNYVPGPVWAAWNPNVLHHPAWQIERRAGLFTGGVSADSCRYVFKRGGIRFIVCDWSYSDEQRRWIRGLITRPDDSSVTIVLHHAHYLNKLSRYFEALQGRHNVKLVLSGHDHRYHHVKLDGITYITGAGIARADRECDAMILSVYRHSLRLERYIIPKGSRRPTVVGPMPIWTCRGNFTEYIKPAPQTYSPVRFVEAGEPAASGLKLSRNGYSWDGIFYDRTK